MRFVLRWLISSIAVAVAAWLVTGIEITGNAWVAVLVAALIVGFVNATLGLIFRIGALGCIIMTLGLFNLVINALMLWLSSWIAQQLGVGFVVDGFWPALWGGLVIGIVSGLLNWFVRPEEDR